MTGAGGAREALGDALRAALAEAAKCRPGVRPCKSCGRNAGEVMAAADALVADEVLKAADMTLERARVAEDKLAALEGRLADVIAAALKGERERVEAAEAKVAQAREGIGNFLEQYGDSDILMFKVATDLANSLRKVLGDSKGACDA